MYNTFGLCRKLVEVESMLARRLDMRRQVLLLAALAAAFTSIAVAQPVAVTIDAGRAGQPISKLILGGHRTGDDAAVGRDALRPEISVRHQFPSRCLRNR